MEERVLVDVDGAVEARAAAEELEEALGGQQGQAQGDAVEELPQIAMMGILHHGAQVGHVLGREVEVRPQVLTEAADLGGDDPVVDADDRHAQLDEGPEELDPTPGRLVGQRDLAGRLGDLGGGRGPGVDEVEGQGQGVEADSRS